MEFIQILVYVSIYIGLIATSFYILSYVSDSRKKKEFYSDDELPKVSVIIPAYNEEKTIEKTLNSIRDSDYPDFEVIVVDDGSKDNTFEVAKKFESERVRVFRKENGGKGTALNFGIARAKGEIIFSMDADTRVDKRSMGRMVRYFKNPRIMSVTPAMVTEKPETIWQRVQYIEYLTGLFLRKSFAALESVYVAPGAFSAYRKSFFDKHGGYEVGNITEDLELALRIQSKGYVTENCPDAPAYTVGPRGFKALMIQRRRWYYGMIKNLWRYKFLFGKRTGDLGTFVMPIAIISIFFSLVITIYLFFKTLFNVRSEFLFLQNINYDFLSSLDFNFYVLERTLFLFFSNPVVLFILLFLILVGGYIYYAGKRVGKVHGLFINVPLFFILFAILFGFWWIVSIFYAVFYKEIKWR